MAEARSDVAEPKSLKELKDEIKELRNEKQVLAVKIVEHNHNIRKKLVSEDKNKKLRIQLRKWWNRALKAEILWEKMQIPVTRADESTIMTQTFKSMYEEAKRVRVLCNPNNNIPMDIRLHSWRGIVSKTPDFSWNIGNVSDRYRPTYQKKFFVANYALDCTVMLQLSSAPDPRIKCLQVFVKAKDKFPRTMPSIVAVFKASGESVAERLNAASYVNNIYLYDSRRFMSEAVAVGNVSTGRLSVEFYFELNWSAEEVHSHNGVLYWTVKNVSQLLRRDDRKLYSPRFLTDKDNGFRMQAVLQASTENELKLRVEKRIFLGPYKDPNYLIWAIIFKPQRPDFKKFEIRSTNLMQDEIFGLGKFEDVVVSDDTFFCKVIVRENA